MERSGLQGFRDGLGKDQLSRCPRLSRQYNGSYNIGDCGKIGNMNILAGSEFLLNIILSFYFGYVKKNETKVYLCLRRSLGK